MTNGFFQAFLQRNWKILSFRSEFELLVLLLAVFALSVSLTIAIIHLLFYCHDLRYGVRESIMWSSLPEDWVPEKRTLHKPRAYDYLYINGPLIVNTSLYLW